MTYTNEPILNAPHKDPAPPVTDLGHEIRPGTRKRLIAVAVTVPAVLAATVGGYLLGTQSSGPAADTNSSVSGEETHASGETTQGEPAAASEMLVPNWETVLAFNDAKGEAGTEAMKSLVSPGSPAERWLKHQEIVDSTTVAAGRTPVAIWGSSVIDEAAGTVRTTYRYGGTIVTKDYVTDENGLIVSWSDEAGVPIGDRLWTQNPAGSAAGQTVTVTSASLLSDGTLTINLDIASRGASSADFAPIYVRPDGVALTPLTMDQPADGLTPGAASKVNYMFSDANDFGGTFIYKAWNDDTHTTGDISLTIK